jgi:hypothetical protein
MNEIGDQDTPAEPAEDNQEVDEGNTYGSSNSGIDGVVYEEDKEDCKYCGGDCPHDEEHACDGYLGDIDDLYKDTVKEDEEDDDGGFEAIQSAIIRRIAHSHHELLMKLGPDGVLEAAREIANWTAPVEEIGSSDVSGWVRQIEQDAGIESKEVTEERDIDDSEQVCVYCGEPRDDKFGCCEENHFISKKEFDQDNEVNEAKDKVSYDPKTGKLTGWEHEGDWKKSKGKKKDPVGKIHHMSDVARRRTEKMSEEETLEEAFERALNEAAINVGDVIKDKTQPTIQGKVVGDIDENYIIQVEDDQYHIKKLNAEKVAKEAIEMPDNPDYSGYDKPTFQRKGITPGQPNKTLPGMNDKKKPGWVGVDTTKPAYQRQADYEQEREQMKKLAGVK